MLLIGSRAIRMHLPEFREPVDWDLIGTEAEAERLRRVLREIPQSFPSPHKVNFLYNGAPVEMILIERWEEWKKLYDHFLNSPTFTDPVLGEMTLPPASFLMLTKHCALGYPVMNWHKNMAEVYWMKNYIPEIPSYVAETVAMLQESCRLKYANAHEIACRYPTSCHPKAVRHQNSALHEQLHERFKLGPEPMVRCVGAWQAFPDRDPQERTDFMRRVMAEEAMVFAGHKYVETERSESQYPSKALKRYALRNLLTGGLPQAWRYFGVNNYREIASLIPEDFLDEMSELDALRPNSKNSCASETELGVHDDDLFCD